MISALRNYIHILVTAGKNWSEDQATTLSAALAYYAVFSIAPLLVILVAITGLVLGQHSGSSEVSSALERAFGPQASQGIQAMAQNISAHPAHGIFAVVLGVITLIVGASAVFVQLQQSLDLIWRVQTRSDRTVAAFIRQRLISFSMLVVIGIVLIASVAVTALIAVMVRMTEHILPPHGEIALHLLNLGAGLALLTLLFALVYKFMPDVQLGFRDVWAGAILTSILFTLGKTGIGLYLGKSATLSAYGAAGSFAMVLLWVYYSALIFYFGAEVTRASVLARRTLMECKNIAQPMPGFEHQFDRVA